jgi:hypothetical protein
VRAWTVEVQGDVRRVSVGVQLGGDLPSQRPADAEDDLGLPVDRTVDQGATLSVADRQAGSAFGADGDTVEGSEHGVQRVGVDVDRGQVRLASTVGEIDHQPARETRAAGADQDALLSPPHGGHLR